MTKQIKQTDVQTVEQLTDRIKEKLNHVWQQLDDNPQAQALVQTAWDEIRQLGHVNNELDALLRGAQAALKEAIAQRDTAVTQAYDEKRFAKFEIKTLRKAGMDKALRQLAAQIAKDGNMPLSDVMRVLKVLNGETSTLEEYAQTDLYTIIAELGEYLFEEQVFNATTDDEDDS